MGDPSPFWLAQLDAELHECHLPQPRRGRIHSCECGCIWEVLFAFGPQGQTSRWALTRDPDRMVR